MGRNSNLRSELKDIYKDCDITYAAAVELKNILSNNISKNNIEKTTK